MISLSFIFFYKQHYLQRGRFQQLCIIRLTLWRHWMAYQWMRDLKFLCTFPFRYLADSHSIFAFRVTWIFNEVNFSIYYLRLLQFSYYCYFISLARKLNLPSYRLALVWFCVDILWFLFFSFYVKKETTKLFIINLPFWKIA